MAEVYWIHLPEHTDMFTEGYIGYTKSTAKTRFKQHVTASSSDKKVDGQIILKAIRKYGKEQLIVQTLVICDEEYGLELERLLRPTQNIGWNIAAGGGVPSSSKGVKRDPSFGAKMKKVLTGRKLSQEHIENQRKTLLGVPHDEERIKQRVYNSFITRMITNKEVWRLADEIHTRFLDGCCKNAIARDLNIIPHKLDRMFKKFKAGWKPEEDVRWLELFKGVRNES